MKKRQAKLKIAAKHIRILNQIYAALAHTNQAVVQCSAEETLFSQVCRIVIEDSGAEMCWIGRPDEAGQMMFIASYGRGLDYLEDLLISIHQEIPEGQGPAGTAFRENRIVTLRNFLDNEKTKPWQKQARHFGWRAVVLIPFTRGTQPYAVLGIYYKDEDILEPKLLDLFGEMARTISLALDRFDLQAEKKAAEEKMLRLAYYDTLTGLPNRTLLTEMMNSLIHSAQNKLQQFAMMYLDLDHFKNINETLGHCIGDQLLIKLAERLRMIFGDHVFRFEGDEFIILLMDTDTEGAARMAERLLEEHSLAICIEGYEMTVSASIGIAMYPQDGQDFETLYMAAHIAMYFTKNGGRNSYQFFRPEQQTSSIRKVQLENDLRKALERDELRLEYQPQVSLKDGSVIGVEALLRWEHPQFGRVSPMEFIPLAEESGLILPIGEWVLRMAIRQMKQWLERGIPLKTMAVNMSAVQLRQVDLPQKVLQLLKNEDLAPEYLELELTESVAMLDLTMAVSSLDALHECGLHLAIDDFGTSYSCLANLKRFKMNELKIDQSFIRKIGVDSEDEVIIGMILGLAKSLQLMTIAEGVETEEQLNFLYQRGCEIVQGYYFSKPMIPEDLPVWVQSTVSSRQEMVQNARKIKKSRLG